MARYKDMSGVKINTFTFISPTNSRNNKMMWECKCDCGIIREINAHDARRNKIPKCICQRVAKQYSNKTYKNRIRPVLYGTWCNMKTRCNNVNDIRYKDYGARGIKLCNDWNDNFISFQSWALSNGYKKGLTIDRIDNNKGYQPDNCKFSTYLEQNKNKRNLIYIQIDNNNKMCLKDFCKLKRLKYNLILTRMRRGWSCKDAIFTPEKGMI